MKTVAFRCTEEQHNLISELLPPSLSGVEKMALIIKSLEAKPNDDNSNYEELEADNVKLLNEIKSLQSENAQIKSHYEELLGKYNDIKDLQENMATDLTFTVPEPAKSLLSEYANRLKTSEDSILIDMFIRYVTEQYNRWFFDFVVKKSEFKEVCGYTHNEVLNWLNSQK